MDYNAILDRALVLIGEGRPALFSTIGKGGFPHARWMVPSVLPRLKGRIYAVTSRGFSKVTEIEADPRALWTLQAEDYSEVLSLEVKAHIVEDPIFSAEVLNAIGPHLPFFWRLNTDPSSLVVVETLIERASILFPERAERFSVEAPRG
jgi:hypothetical protein